MPGVNFFTPQLLANVAKKLLPRQGFYNMSFFILSAAKTMHMLTCHICQIFEICFQNPAFWCHERQELASVGVQNGTVKHEKLVLHITE